MVIPHNSFGSSPLTNCVSVRGISERKKNLTRTTLREEFFDLPSQFLRSFVITCAPNSVGYTIDQKQEENKKICYFLFSLLIFVLI